MINKYTREFKARVQMCKELNSNIGNIVELQKMLCDEERVGYMAMITALSTSDKDKWK